MDKLSKDEISQRDALCARLRRAYLDLDQAVDVLNTYLASHWAAVEQARDAYNAVVQDANTWKGEVGQEIQDFMDERSERWQASERGQAYEAWVSGYLNDDLAEVELEPPSELELVDDDQATMLDDLSEAVE